MLKITHPNNSTADIKYIKIIKYLTPMPGNNFGFIVRIMESLQCQLMRRRFVDSHFMIYATPAALSSF